MKSRYLSPWCPSNFNLKWLKKKITPQEAITGIKILGVPLPIFTNLVFILKKGDELWIFSSDRFHRNLHGFKGGFAGYAIIRNGIVIETECSISGSFEDWTE